MLQNVSLISILNNYIFKIITDSIPYNADEQEHSENEDKHLISQVAGMSNYADTGSVATNYESRGLEGEYSKHLAGVVMSSIYKIHILLYELIDTKYSNLFIFISNVNSSIGCSIRKVHKSVDIIRSIIKLNCKFKGCSTQNFIKRLIQIIVQLKKLHRLLLKLKDVYVFLKYLEIQTQNITKTTNNDTSDFESNLKKLIKVYRCSLCEFNAIEPLIICIRSIIQEILKMKIELINSIYTTQKFQSNDIKIKCLCDNIDRLFSAISDVEFYSYCLKYWICKFINSWNSNILSTSHCVKYISYFYYVFPLHLNSFNRLFSDVITPKLSILIFSVDQFTCITSEIPRLVDSLKGVSSYLNYNPAQELLRIIDEFNVQPYVNGVRDHINDMIEKLNVKAEYQEIINGVHSTHSAIVSSFNGRLKTLYGDFKNEVNKHKSSLGTNIQGYIKKIKDDLTKHLSCVEGLRTSISTAIDNLESNQGKITQFENYKSNEDLIKGYYVEITDYPTDITHFETIFKTHKEYENCLKSCSDIKSKLEELKKHLNKIKDCSEKLTSKLATLSSGEPDTSKIDEVSTQLKGHNSNLEFDKYKGTFEKLQQIGKYITTMKETLEKEMDKTHKKVKDKVVDEAVTYINGLQDIKITKPEVEEEIKKIKGKNDCIIARLEFAKNSIEFYKSLETELDKLTKNSVTFTRNDINEFKTNSDKIKDKLTTFQEKINQAIQKAEQKIEELKKQCPEIEEQGNGKENELILCKLKELGHYYTSEIQNIKSLKEQFLNEIYTINYLLSFLENNKTKSLEHICDIKSEVCNISNLSNAITRLTQIKNELNKFVRLQQTTKALLNTFTDHHKLNTLRHYSDKLEDSLSLLYALIRHTEISKKFLWEIQLLFSLIKWLKSIYKHVFEKIKQIFINFKTYVEVITGKLEAINCYLLILKCDIDKCCSRYNSILVNNHEFYKMKDYMKILKTYLPNIKTKFTSVEIQIEKIKQESLYIEEYECDLKNLEKFIGDYVNCLEKYKQGPLKSVVNYLITIKLSFKGILKVKYLITEPSNMTKINKIGCKLKCVESNVNELECAIEGVVRNTIRCSLKSLSNHLTNQDDHRGGVNTTNHLIVNYSLLNVTNYKSIIDRLYEIWSFSDEATKLFNFITFCPCGVYFMTKNPDARPSTFPYPLYSIRTKDINPVSELAKNTMADNVGNHLCLCLVIKYHLRPAMLKCILYLRNEDLGTLSTISRKHGIYNNFIFSNIDLWKIYCLTLRIIYKILYWIKDKYNFVWVGYYRQPEIKCFCTIKDKVEYHYLISIILYLSSLIENIWSSDSNSVLTAINHLSNLLSEYQTIHVYTNYYSEPRCRIYPLIVDKKCPEKKAQGQKCCCWCVACYNLLLACVSLCVQFRFYEVIKKEANCDKIKEFCKIETAECTCNCQDPQKGLCCLLKLALCSQLPNRCEDLLNKCCQACEEEACCKKVMAKVKEGQADLLVIGCNCNCTSKDETQVKGWCFFFKNPWGGRSVGVVLVCKCEKEKCCCLKNVIENLKDKLKDLCEKCKCDEIIKSFQSICDESGCGDGCPCEQLKKEVKKICNGGPSNCLCTAIEKLASLFKDHTCPCKEKSCCRCVCCKLAISAVRILTGACRQNFLEPYKRMIIELLSGSTDNQVIRSIVNSINNRTLNITYLVKNNYSTRFNTYTDHKNIANSFPSPTMGYGYESVYEHQTRGNSEYKGIDGIREGYPNSRSGIIAIINKMKEKERANIYTLKYLHTGVKSQNNIRRQQ